MSSTNGSRSAASSGGTIAFSTPIAAAAASAPPKPFTVAPGTIHAATSRAAAVTSQERASRIGLIFGRLWLQWCGWPWVGVSALVIAVCRAILARGPPSGLIRRG